MTIRIATAAIATTMFCACSQGQKERVSLQTEIDSVSYAIGVDIGMNFKRSKLDDANLDAMHMGLRDGLDSSAMMDPELVQSVVQGYMMKLQEEKRAEEAKKFEGVRLEGEKYLAENGKKKGVITTPSGLQYEVITMGTGAKPVATDRVKANYLGTLLDGSKIDSSVDHGGPQEFSAGGGVIPGWVEALQMMPVGSKWKLHIPSDLAWGAQGTPDGKVPPNSVVVFEVELMEIVK